MSEEEIEGQLKLSKRQNKNERYDYLCSQFNCVNYTINLEKYTNNLQHQNQKYKEIIDKANNKLNSFIECCKAEKLESGSDYLHHQYWDMFERFNKQIKDILKEVE